MLFRKYFTPTEVFSLNWRGRRGKGGSGAVRQLSFKGFDGKQSKADTQSCRSNLIYEQPTLFFLRQEANISKSELTRYKTFI